VSVNLSQPLDAIEFPSPPLLATTPHANPFYSIYMKSMRFILNGEDMSLSYYSRASEVAVGTATRFW